MSARDAATQVLMDVLVGGRSLTDALAETMPALADERERGLARELCYGVVRWLPRLESIRDHLLERPLRSRDADVGIVILLGLYQLEHTRIPDHAALAETVALAPARGKPWARSLINGVLRGFQRRRTALLPEVDRQPEAAYAHPQWLVGAIREAWPQAWRSVLEANNCHPPMCLRVNGRRSTRGAYREALRAAGIEAWPIRHTSHGLALAHPMEVSALPGFERGLSSVQDGAAQLAAEMLDAPAGARVLDACAAPGGKATHLLEREPAPERLVCVDPDVERLQRLEDNLRRLGLAAEVVHADATAPEDWSDGTPFERILLDAPCSGTGVIRRHPDIKVHRRPEDITAFAALQARLLAALWPLVARGGLLLYATCSILPAENQQPVRHFLESHEDAYAVERPAAWGWATSPGRQILPGENGMDGFYYALLGKR